MVAVPSPDRARERRGSDILGAAVEMTALAQQFAHRAFDQTQQSCEDHILNAICTPFFEKTALGKEDAVVATVGVVPIVSSVQVADTGMDTARFIVIVVGSRVDSESTRT